MADGLGDLFKVAPTTAGFMLGQNLASEDQNQALKRRETLQDILAKQQKYGFDEQNNPLLLDKQRTLNQGYSLDNDKQTLANNETRQTQAGKIAAANAKSGAETLGSHLKQAEETEKFFNQSADQLVNIPPPMRSQWLATQMQQAGLDPSSPGMQQYVQQASQNPQLLKQHAAQIAQERAARMPEYLKMQEEERIKGANALKVAQEHSRGQLESSKVIAAGRVAAASARSQKATLSIYDQVRSGKLKASEMPAAFELEARKTDDPEEKAFFMEQAYKAQKALLDKPNAKGTPEIDDKGIRNEKPTPVYGTPKGKGTAEDPIKLD